MITLPTVDANPHLHERIRALAAEHDTLIIAHNYQLPEVQAVADLVGDSLQLSRWAAAAPERQILFCGVHFMAESASVLSPDKRVLLPDHGAGCSLADSITVEQLRAWQDRYEDPVTIMYVNTSAAVKALTDVCCTSSNAVQVVEWAAREWPGRPILFGPDLWLGSFVARRTDVPIHVWDGECHVHAGIRPSDLTARLERHPDAELLIHPECGCSTQAMEFVAAGDLPADRVRMLSTGQMLDHVRARPDGRYIVATETGMLHGLGQAAPNAELIAANSSAVCAYMKMITMPKLLAALTDPEHHEVSVDPSLATRARLAIDRMVAIG